MRMNRCPLANRDPSIENANRVILEQQCVMLWRSNQRIEISHQVNGLTEKRVVSPNYPVSPGDTIKIAERWF